MPKSPDHSRQSGRNPIFSASELAEAARDPDSNAASRLAEGQEILFAMSLDTVLPVFTEDVVAIVTAEPSIDTPDTAAGSTDGTK